MTQGRLVVVATSPRTPPGLLSWPAWEVVRGGPVHLGDGGSPHVPFLRDAGVDVRPLDRPAPVPSLALAGPVHPADLALAGSLHARAVAGERVVWLADADADAALVQALTALAARERAVELELVYGAYDPPGARLLDVVAVMDRLRSPGGCPWDAAQTHRSLAPYLIEEAYEAYQALEDDDPVALREELGDVLLQVAFHARLAQELPDPWTIDDVAGDLVAKLVRRHPHVFAGGDADDLEGSWDALKKAEKGRSSVTEGVPLSQPALALAAKLQKRAGRLGAPVPAYDGLGGRLWEAVRACREAGEDPEAALRAVARQFRDRLAELERDVVREGGEPSALTPEQWSARW